MSNASISTTVLGPYHLVSSVSGVNYGSQYNSTKLTCRASYNLDGVNYSRDIQSWTNGVTSATCNIDGPLFNSTDPWKILPDGDNVNITWIAESSGSGGSGSASKTVTTNMPFAYSAYVIESGQLGTSRTWTVIDDNKMLTSNNLTTMLGYVQQNYPEVQGDFDLILDRVGDTNRYTLKLHTSEKTITIFSNFAPSQAQLWMNSNMGTSLSTFQTRSSYYTRDTFVRFSYHLAKITPADLKVSASQGAQPLKWVRRLENIYPTPEPFKGWGYLYIGDTNNEEDWAEFNLDEQDFLRLCTNKNYIVVGGRKFDKSLVRAISFGPNVEEIGSFFLRDCVNLNYDIELPNTCTHIGDYFLAGCTSFNSQIDLENVTELGNFFMQDCTVFNQELDVSQVEEIGMGFMLRCSSFNQNLDLSNLTTFKTYFLSECDNFCSQITLGTNQTYTADIHSFSTIEDDTLLYLNGIEIAGTQSQVNAFRTTYPERNSSPYRWFYSSDEVEALTAKEYDDLQLTSNNYDNHQLTARQYDTKGKTILM
ncbi:MAG: leucine-rich repeat protein [Methanobrevibacter sp.]|nr:leucine-rich repeat protein [Methanobrevibacter sp.]